MDLRTRERVGYWISVTLFAIIVIGLLTLAIIAPERENAMKGKSGITGGSQQTGGNQHTGNGKDNGLSPPVPPPTPVKEDG